MANITVSGGGSAPTTITFPTTDAAALAQSIANIITATATTAATIVSSTGTTFLPSTTTATTITATSPVTVVSNNLIANVIAGSAGVAFFAAPASTDNVAIAGGNNTVGTGSGSTYNIATGSGNDVIYANGSGSVDAGAGTNLIFAGNSSVASNFVTTYGNSDTVALGDGVATVAEGGTGGIVFGGTGSNLIADTGTANTIVGGVGSETIFGGSSTTYFLASSASLFVANPTATGSDTIIGRSYPAQSLALINSIPNVVNTVFGGLKDLVFANDSKMVYVAAAGASPTISTGYGADTITGAAGANITVFAPWSGNARGMAPIIQAGSGNETLNGASSQYSMVFVGGSGAASMVGGQNSPAPLFTDIFFAGTGNNTVTGGNIANTYAFVAGKTGGTETITNFKSSDNVALIGYGGNEVSNALATATSTTGGTTITLADNTKVTFIGAPALNTTNVTGF